MISVQSLNFRARMTTSILKLSRRSGKRARETRSENYYCPDLVKAHICRCFRFQRPLSLSLSPSHALCGNIGEREKERGRNRITVENESVASIDTHNHRPMDCKSCLICAVSIGQHSLRLGLEACRSCAAFFKRTILAGRRFTCRQGKEQCSTKKSEKRMCRRCRFDKCVRLGMELHLRKKKGTSADAKSVETDIPSSSSSDGAADNGRENTLLNRIEHEYRESCERRLKLENEYVTKHNLPSFHHPEKKFFHANFTAFCELHRVTIKECAALIRKVFDDFDTFPVEHRITLYKNFAMKLSMTEGVYFSAKYLTKFDSSMFVSSLITCASSELWRPHDDKLENNNALRTTVKQYSCEYLDLFRPMSKMDALTEREFYALLILNYCDVDILALPEDIIRSTQRIRARLFEELQEYYQCELKLGNFSQRIGNMMTLAQGMGEAGKLMNEEMRMCATIFDLYADDQMFREFFLQ